MTNFHAGKRPNPYADEYASFVAQTAGHQLTVLREDGLYRHLRMHNPEMGSMWSWQVVTVPWFLTTFGDVADGYSFSREEDMLEFFSHAGTAPNYYTDGAPLIDFRYWAEKLRGGRSREVKQFSPQAFIEQVEDDLTDLEELDETRRASILADAREHADDEHTARAWLDEAEQRELFGQDTWEWDCTDFDTHFLFTCWAIHLTASSYLERTTS